MTPIEHKAGEIGRTRPDLRRDRQVDDADDAVVAMIAREHEQRVVRVEQLEVAGP